MPVISIAIVTYNNADTIGKAMAALVAHWPEDATLRIYVIDNGSTDQTQEKLTPYLDRITFIQSGKGNIGFGAANNLILDQLDSEYHVIMNPDVYLLDRDSLLTMTKYLDDHPDVGMVAPKIVDEKGELQYLCRRNPTVLDLLLRFSPIKTSRKRQDMHVMKDMDYNTSFPIEFASGCFMMIRTDLYRKLGGFDERFFLYAEDADLTRRVNQTSQTVYVPEATVCHAWKRASYRDPAMTRIHLKSLWKYFRKWGFKFK